ncbi:phytanoyl-CoA dioxygenase family protein [Thalassoroseus pseudoceratinae]|uniref:phytanoyl-CoA dioxygenase family protein n=1 Tax=Thalassoroseus pseudoceratinae TaxID=2713176 RepID=UPI00141F85CC|nr:phytanoyl-CoA dioxygenase family protein [Thalassoroseus pseudoceratinae]
MPTLAESLEVDGFAIVDPFLADDELRTLSDSINRLPSTETTKRGQYAARQLAERVPEVRGFAESPILHRLLEPLVGSSPRLTRSILFNKTPAANWGVFWHQDLTIAVQERHDIPGFEQWSVKDGIPHVQPPVEILEHMLTVRFHLDACDETNGALRVQPGTHQHGRIPQANIMDHVNHTTATSCHTKAGGAVLMRPLLLHSSRKMTNPTQRRVIHLEFTTQDLPAPLTWRDTACTFSSTKPSRNHEP